MVARARRAPSTSNRSALMDLNRRLPMLSMSSVVELSWLLGAARRVVRFSVGGPQVSALRRELERLGLFSGVSSVALRPIRQPGSGHYALGGIETEVTDPRALSIVFVAREQRPLSAALEAERDDGALGELFDYPPCCIAHYALYKGEYARGFAPLFRHGPGPWPWWSNALLAEFGALALSHLPCAPDCELSGERARRHFAAVSRKDAGHAEVMQRWLASVVVWHPELGTAAARTAVWSTTERRLVGLGPLGAGFRARAAHGELDLVDPEPGQGSPVLFIDHRGQHDAAD